MSNRVDLSSNGSSSTQASQELIKGLVEKGGFTQGNGAEDATSGAKADGKGKGTAKTNNAAKLTAPKAPAADGRQVDRVDTAASGGGAAAARNGGGSLNIGADTMHASRQAAEVGELATAAATAAPASDVPLVEDKNPKIAAAQKQLARDMADPSTSQEQLQRDVKNLVDVTKQQGRASDTLQLLNNAMPAGTSASKSGSIWEMAAKAGVDLDNNASKFKALKADTAVNKALRDQQKAQAASAAAAAGAGSGGGKAQAKDGGAQGSGGAGGSGEAKKSGPSGPSSWNGQKASASSATKDTSQAGGSKMSYSGPAENFPNDPGKWASWDDL